MTEMKEMIDNIEETEMTENTEIEIPTVPKSQSVFGALVYWITILAAVMCILGPLIAFFDIDANIINPHYEMSNIFDGMKPNFDVQDLQANAAAGDQSLIVKDASKFDNPDDVDRDVNIRIMGSNGQGEIATLTATHKDTNTIDISKPLINSYTAQEAEIGELIVWAAPGNFRLASAAVAGTKVLTLRNIDRIEEPTADRQIAIVIQDDSNREQVFVDEIDKDAKTITLTTALVNSYPEYDAYVTQVTAPETFNGHFWVNNLSNGDGLTQLGLVLGCAVGIPAMGGAALILIKKEKSYGWAIGALLIVLLIILPATGIV